MRKLWHDEAWEEYLYWQSQGDTPTRVLANGRGSITATTLNACISRFEPLYCFSSSLAFSV